MNGGKFVFDRDECDLIVAFAGCSLDESPGKNWVEKAGGLPDYICEIARAIKRTGKTTSQAIAIAVARVKKWATGIGVDKNTQAKSAAAVAAWEKLKGKNKAKNAGKDAENVAASRSDHQVLCLSDYNMDDVRSAFNARIQTQRSEWRTANPGAAYDDPRCPQSFYVKEVWNTFIIVASEYGRDADLYKVTYSVDDNNDVTFGDPVEVKTQYVVIDEGSEDDPGGDLTDATLKSIVDMSAKASTQALTKILNLTATPSPLTRLLAATALADSGEATPHGGTLDATHRPR